MNSIVEKARIIQTRTQRFQIRNGYVFELKGDLVVGKIEIMVSRLEREESGGLKTQLFHANVAIPLSSIEFFHLDD